MKRFASHDGVEIAYDEWGSGGNSAPLVVLHHGFAANAKLNWVVPGVVAALVAAGRRVAALDARGHGESGKPQDSAAYGEATMARDLMRLVDLLGAPRYDLVGYSMGAIVSLLVAAQDKRVRRLVIGGVGEGVIECGGVDTRILPNRELAAALESDNPAAITHQGAANMRALADMLGADRRALAAQARAVHASPIALDQIRAPTLLLAGDTDPLAVRPHVLTAAISDARLQIVSGDHLGAINDARFIPAVVAFLAMS